MDLLEIEPEPRSTFEVAPSIEFQTYIVDRLLVCKGSRWDGAFHDKFPACHASLVINIEQRSDSATAITQDAHQSEVATHAPKEAPQRNRALACELFRTGEFQRPSSTAMPLNPPGW